MGLWADSLPEPDEVEEFPEQKLYPRQV